MWARSYRPPAGRYPHGSHVSDAYEPLAPFYDRLTGDVDDDLPMYESFARRLEAPVLELGVGTGRVAVRLARRGFAVTGIDRSEAMLTVARGKARAAGVALTLVRADLRSYRLPRRFGLILCAADGFLHLADTGAQIDALRCAAAHLAPNGRIVLDLPSLGGDWGDWRAGLRPLELVWSETLPDATTVQYFTTSTMDPAAQRRTVTHLLDTVDADGVVRRRVVRFHLRFIAPGELPLLAERAGLRLDAVYGGYDLEPFAGDCARMIAVLAGAGG